MPRPTMADNQSTIRRGWALRRGSLVRVTGELCGRGRDGSRLQHQLAEVSKIQKAFNKTSVGFVVTAWAVRMNDAQIVSGSFGRLL